MGNTPFREAYIEAGDAAHIAKVADAVKDRINVPLPDEPEKFPHSSGCTPLTFALGEPHPSLEKIQALLRVGARVDQADINNNYPLAVCCRNAAASGAILSALLEHIPAPQRNCIHQREGDGHSPLQVLSASLVKRAPADAAACVRVLVQHGANLAETDSAGNSVLHIANGHENHNGSVPIFRAFAGLLEGPTVSVALRPNNADVTPLHLAAGRGCPADVQMLLVLGADPDAVDVKGDTVLHYLAASNCTEEDVEACCAALRAANANPNVHNKKHGETPLTLAGTQGQITFIAPFFKHFHTVPGFDVNAKNNNGDAALHTFFDHGSFPLLKLIKECGADPNAQGHDGNTVLHLCALREQHFTMKALLAEVGSFDVELENAKGKTVLALCAAGKYKCHSHMQLLLMGYDRA